MMKRNLGSVRQSLLHVGVAGSVLFAGGLATAGCLDRELRPLVPCVSQGFVESIEQNAVDKVDLLFMVDNSGSMSEEQASLGTELPRMVTVLTTGDRTGDGPTMDDFAPVKNLHVGVITSDMGVAGFNVPTCTRNPMSGDDGLLRTVGNTSIAGCMATYPTFLEYIPGTSPQTPMQFGADFRCVAATGIGGCGFEQQLEATLKAITPRVSPIQFLAGTSGHGDVENAGFLREDSVIALVLVTDEEDCSIQAGSEDIFNQTSAIFTGDLNLRCFLYKDAQWDVRRYIDGFKALRTGSRESLLVFGAIAGVPLDLVTAGTPNYAGILADSRMVEAVDTSPGAVGARLVPSCNVPGRGIAFPPRRIVEVAQGFGQNGIVQSICQASFAPALDAIIAKIADALGEVCLPRTLNPDASGLVDCDVIAVVPAPGGIAGVPTTCAELGGIDTSPDAIQRVNADRSTQCPMLQLSTSGIVAPGVPTGQGWYYEDLRAATGADVACAGKQRIAFTSGAVPPNGVTVNLECLQRVQGSGGGNATDIQVGTPCTSDTLCTSASPMATAPMGLACEPASRSCQIVCVTDADCPSSLVCDVLDSSGYCRNPICID